MKYLSYIFCCFALLIPAACSQVEKAKDKIDNHDSSNSGSDKQESFPENKLSELKKQTIKAAEGGTITIGEGDSVDASLDIPAGALAEDTEITVFKIDESALPKNAAGPAYEFKPDGLQFSKAVTLKIKYTTDNTENLKLAQIFFNSDDYTALDNNKVDSENKMVAGETTHFSAYAPVITTASDDNTSNDNGSDTSTTTDTSTSADDDNNNPDETTEHQNDQDAGDNTNIDDNDSANDDNNNNQSDDDTAVSTNDNCTKYAKALCEKEVSCKFAGVSSTNIDCQKFAESSCKDWWMNRVNKADSSQVNSCITTLNTLACDTFSNGEDVNDPNCNKLFQGTIVNGQPCGETLGDTCKDGSCKYDYSSSSMCGICTAFQKIGDTCDTDQYYCYISSSETVPCNDNKCTALPTENQPCINYDCADGLYCDYGDYTSDPMCKKETVVKENEDCTYGTGKICETGLTCKYDQTTYKSTCIKKTSALKPGDVCEASKRCEWPAFCKVAQAKDTQGICVIGSLPKAGDPCPLDNYCEGGSRCDDTSELCVSLLNDGDTCDPYEYGWDCKSGYCDEITNK